MNKITTADCKKFLVAEISKNPNIIHDIFQNTTTAISEALVEKKWKRESKFDPTGDNDYVEDAYDLWHPKYSRKSGSIKAIDLVAIRRFCLDPAQFEDTVIFNVLEDKQGNLHLGEYVGD